MSLAAESKVPPELIELFAKILAELGWKGIEYSVGALRHRLQTNSQMSEFVHAHGGVQLAYDRAWNQ